MSRVLSDLSWQELALKATKIIASDRNFLFLSQEKLCLNIIIALTDLQTALVKSIIETKCLWQ